MRMHDSTSATNRRKSGTATFSHFTSHMSDDPVSSTLGQIDIWISLNRPAEGSSLDEILVNSRTCTVLSDGSVGVSSPRLKHRCLFDSS